ncbi:MAG: division/cell wall cluster transcriptional repressor MraZ [Lachnospiraceae bacterium]|nr:division/cell wall cluster transcriptional repressor MraZ [Lachnospiraceae bacterium]
MFLHTYEHSIDAKGRLIIPAKYRDDIDGKPVVVTRGWDANLVVYTMDAWEEYVKSWLELPGSDPKVRKYRRFIATNAEQCELDKQGRILISQTLRDHAGLDKDVIISGNLTNFEIWSPERWEEISDFGDDDTIAREIGELNARI